ncbi:MAG: hypothetical protein U0165_04475 [Polyangiaceae bacterium]
MKTARMCSKGFCRRSLSTSAPLPTEFPPQAFVDPSGSPVRLGASEQRTDVDFVMRAGAVKLRGHVDDLTGGGVPGAFVSTVSDDGARAVATSDGKGRLRAVG